MEVWGKVEGGKCMWKGSVGKAGAVWRCGERLREESVCGKEVRGVVWGCKEGRGVVWGCKEGRGEL